MAGGVSGGKDVASGEIVESGDGDTTEGEAVTQPAKLLRIAGMLRSLQGACQDVPLDDQGRNQLAGIQAKAVTALEDVLSEELHDELVSIFPVLGEHPTEGEVRVAQAQLVGWLEGLFQGIQATIAMQQASAQQQLMQMRAHRPDGSPDQRSLPGYGTYL